MRPTVTHLVGVAAVRSNRLASNGHSELETTVLLPTAPRVAASRSAIATACRHLERGEDAGDDDCCGRPETTTAWLSPPSRGEAARSVVDGAYGGEEATSSRDERRSPNHVMVWGDASASNAATANTARLRD